MILAWAFGLLLRGVEVAADLWPAAVPLAFVAGLLAGAWIACG